MLCAGAAAPARAQFSVSPVIVQLSSADTAATAVVQVRNDGAAAQQFRIYVGDFDQREDGEHTFLQPGRHPRSCSGRLRVFPDGTVLRPGERQDIVVRMLPGPGTCWSMVFVETVVRTTQGITIGQRVAVKAYGVRPLAQPAGEITTVRVDERRKPPTLSFELRNTGEVPLRPSGRVEVRKLTGEVVAMVPVEPFSVLPAHRRQLAIPLVAVLLPARYLAIPILDFGGDYLVGGQTTFRVQ